MTPADEVLDDLRNSIELFREQVARGRFENKLTLGNLLDELEINIACWLTMLDTEEDEEGEEF